MIWATLATLAALYYVLAASPPALRVKLPIYIVGGRDYAGSLHTTIVRRRGKVHERWRTIYWRRILTEERGG